MRRDDGPSGGSTVASVTDAARRQATDRPLSSIYGGKVRIPSPTVAVIDLASTLIRPTTTHLLFINSLIHNSRTVNTAIYSYFTTVRHDAHQIALIS